MAPGSGKRKRPERQSTQEDGNRPSPHRPESLSMAQQHSSRNYARGGRGGRRGSAHTSINHNPPPVTPQARPENVEQATPRPSQSATPAQQAPISAPPPQMLVDDEPAGPIRPYYYEYLTDNVMGSWKETGRQAVLEQIAQADMTATSILYQELLRAGLDKRMNSADAGLVVRDIIATKTGEDVSDFESLFIDTMSFLFEKDQQRKTLAIIALNTGIDLDTFRRELDVALLQNLQLVRPSFDRMRTRKTTNVLYRQANFNLVREESEGYAKLITEFYNLSEAASKSGSDPEMVKEAFQRIMALVGAFDLDVGRSLDILFDVSANVMVKSYRFLVKFFRHSSWWPEDMTMDNIQSAQEGPSNLPCWALPGSKKWQYDEQDNTEITRVRLERDLEFWDHARSNGIHAFLTLGSRVITNYDAILPLLEQELPAEPDAKGRDILGDQRKRINENRRFMKMFKALPPSGNPDAAQLLGFKLRYYASPALGEKERMSENLIYLVAMLIKIGFISLRDLYPHIQPSDEDMAQEKERLEKEKEERDRKNRPGGGMNALTMAGALADDSIPAVRGLKADAAKSGGDSPAPEKKGKDSDKDPGPPVNQKILLVKALLAIGVIPEALVILGNFPWMVDLDPTLPEYLHRVVNQMLSKLVLTIQPAADSEAMSKTKPQPIDVAVDADGMFRLLPRPKTKIRKYLGLDGPDKGDGYEEKHYYTDWEENIPICQNIEDFFTLCGTFLNYLGVKVGQNSLLMVTMIRLARKNMQEDPSEQNTTRWLDLIRRIILPALSLSKHSLALTNEMWSLMNTFSISTRYKFYEEWYTGKTSRLPDIRSAFDINRAEVKDVLRRITNESGAKQARSLAAVACASPGIVMMTFINQLESYSNMIPGLVDSVKYFTPLAYDILTWVLIRSLNGQGRQRMQADGMLTSAWLQALSQFVASLWTRYPNIDPSPVLQYIASELRKGDSTNLELIDQVIAEMAGIRSDMDFNDTQLAAMTGGPILRSLTVQQVGDLRHKRSGSARRLMKALTQPKLIGQMLIAMAQEAQMYAHRPGSKHMPLKVLGNNMDKIQQVLAQYLEMLVTHTSIQEFRTAVPDVIDLIGGFGLKPAQAFAISRHVIAFQKAQADIAKKAQAVKQTSIASNGDTVMQDADKAVNGTSSAAPAPPWHPVLEDIVTRLPAVTGDLSERISMPFFVTFWTLSAQDVSFPQMSYDSAKERLDKERKMVEKDTTDSSSSANLDRLTKLSDLDLRRKKLVAETQDRLTALRDIRLWLNTQKKHWFDIGKDEASKAEHHRNLLQECFITRALFSALDANYSFTLLRIMHSNNTPGFSLHTLMEQLFQKSLLAALVFQCTAKEAENLGRFLCALLQYMSTWHAKKETYEIEAYGTKKLYTGFATEVDDNNVPTAFHSYEDFRRVLFTWHNNLKDAFKMCFESKEYMHIRNGIIVLKGVHTVFPALKFHGKAMQDAIKAISDADPRGDLKLAALSLQGPLKNREKKWVIPQDFKLSEMKDASSNGQNGDADMIDAEKSTDESKLNASAAEFKPTTTAATNGGSRKDSTTAAEDGEIQDDKPTVVNTPEITMPDATDSKDSSVKDVHTQQTKVAGTNTASNTAAPQSTSHASANGRKPATAQSTARQPAAQVNGKYSSRGDDRFGRLDRPDSRGRVSRSRSPVPRSRDRSVERMRDPGGEVQRIRREDRPPLSSTLHDNRPARDDARNVAARSPRPVEERERQNYANHAHAGYSDRQNNTSHAHAGHPDRVAQIKPDPTRGSYGHSRDTHAGNATPNTANVNAQPPLNPQRAALINGDANRDDNGRRGDRPTLEQRASGRLDSQRDADHRTEVTPTGPRAGRAGTNRDLFEQPAGRNVPPESGRGRLNRDGHSQAESNYGRLNGPDTSPPSRAPNGPSQGRGLRSMQSTGPPLLSRASEPNLQSVVNHAPEGSASRGPRPRAPVNDRPSTSSSGTDRPSAVNTISVQAASDSGPAIHPSRLANLGGQTIDTNVNAATPAGSPGAQPPSGPRGPGRRAPPTPTGPSPTNSLPTGPANGADRVRRGDRARPGPQPPLQPASNTAGGTQGVNFRGAARQNNSNTNFSAHEPAEQPRLPAPSADVQPRNEPATRIDPGRAAMMERNNGLPEINRNDRKRPSRNSSRERRPDDSQFSRQNSQENYGPPGGRARDERSVVAGGKRGRDDDVPPRRPPPNAPGSFSSQPTNQEWNGRGGPGRGYDDRARDNGPPRSNDDFRGPRRLDEGNHEPDSRKRRYEDGPGAPFDGAKRRRSGR